MCGGAFFLFFLPQMLKRRTSALLPITLKYCRWWGLLAQLLTTGTQLNSSALLNCGTSAPLLAIYCWQQLKFIQWMQFKN